MINNLSPVESKMISSAYIKQCIGLSLRITGSEDFSKYLGSSFINILNKLGLRLFIIKDSWG
jgi:hypothetical protein